MLDQASTLAYLESVGITGADAERAIRIVMRMILNG